jgi:hypothetical protein
MNPLTNVQWIKALFRFSKSTLFLVNSNKLAYFLNKKKASPFQVNAFIRVEPEGFEPSSKQGSSSAFYMFISLLIFDCKPEANTQFIA